MLRATDGSNDLALSRAGRNLLVVLAVSAALAASALRSPAQKEVPITSDTTKKTPRPVTVQSERSFAGGFQSLRGFDFKDAAPFDISYVAPEAQGVFAFRPAAIFGRTDTKAFADMINGELKKGLAQVDFLPPDLAIEEIEQMVVTLQLKTRKTGGEGQSMLITGPMILIRATRDFDWKTYLYSLYPQTKTMSFEGEIYHKIEPASPLSFVISNFYMIPDGRTIVFDTEKNLQRCIREQGKPSRAPLWTEDWKQVARGLVAISVDLRDRGWLKERRQPEEDVSAAVVKLCENASSMVFGLDYTNQFWFKALVRSDSDAAGDAVAAAIDDFIGFAKDQLAKQITANQNERKKGASTEALLEQFDLAFYKSHFDHTAIVYSKPVLQVESFSPTQLPELMKAIMEGAFAKSKKVED